MTHQRILKSDILKACIKKQESLIINFQKRLDDSREDAYSHNDTPSQTDEGSTSPEELLHVLEQELGFVKYEMDILKSMDPDQVSDHVERGAVVVTDLRVFFICVSSEEVIVNDTKVFGMSEKAPLYTQMKGLKAGDSFQFNQLKYQIEDIY
jgi:hypothetical protein